MYLYIDPSSSAHIKFTLIFRDRTQEIVREGKNRELLNVLVDVLEYEHISFHDIEGIAVLVGVGGFSSTRIASVVGNAFAYALKIPIVGISEGSSLTAASLADLCTLAPRGTYLSPAYSGEPNIGKST